jgi:hypothetical protein
LLIKIDKFGGLNDPLTRPPAEAASTRERDGQRRYQDGSEADQRDGQEPGIATDGVHWPFSARESPLIYLKDLDRGGTVTDAVVPLSCGSAPAVHITIPRPRVPQG